MAIWRIASCMAAKLEKLKLAASKASRRRISLSVMRALTPRAPQSPVNSPARSGPKCRKKGVPLALPALPVDSISPVPVMTSILSSDSADTPLPWLMLFWDIEPPMVAANPENGPQNGVRKPRAPSASCSSAQVTPASTVTTALCSSI